jgi:hypothetical protein
MERVGKSGAFRPEESCVPPTLMPAPSRAPGRATASVGSAGVVGMVDVVLPAGAPRGLHQAVLAGREPLQILLAQGFGLQRFEPQGPGHRFEHRAPVIGKRLLVRVEDLNQCALDAPVGGAAQNLSIATGSPRKSEKNTARLPSGIACGRGAP